MPDPTQMAEDPVDQAQAALKVLFAKAPTGGNETITVSAEPALPQAEPATPTPPEPAAQAAAEPTVETVPASDPVETDDIASLRAELARVKEQALRTADWSRNLALRKSSEADRYRTVIDRLRKGEQLETSDLDRILGGTPIASTQPDYQLPPQPQPNVLAPVAQADEMAAIDTQQFLLETGLNEAEAASFQAFIQNPASPIGPRDIVQGDTYNTLRLAYNKYRASQAPPPTTVAAVKAVARAQKAAAQAAGATSGRASPTPPAEAPITDPAKMELDTENMTFGGLSIGALVRAAAEQGR